MTPSEIITEALYNIYGSSTPDASVLAHATKLLERIYDNVQKGTLWWFLRREYEAVSSGTTDTSDFFSKSIFISEQWKGRTVKLSTDFEYQGEIGDSSGAMVVADGKLFRWSSQYTNGIDVFDMETLERISHLSSGWFPRIEAHGEYVWCYGSGYKTAIVINAGTLEMTDTGIKMFKTLHINGEVWYAGINEIGTYDFLTNSKTWTSAIVGGAQNCWNSDSVWTIKAWDGTGYSVELWRKKVTQITSVIEDCVQVGNFTYSINRNGPYFQCYNGNIPTISVTLPTPEYVGNQYVVKYGDYIFCQEETGFHVAYNGQYRGFIPKQTGSRMSFVIGCDNTYIFASDQPSDTSWGKLCKYKISDLSLVVVYEEITPITGLSFTNSKNVNTTFDHIEIQKNGEYEPLRRLDKLPAKMSSGDPICWKETYTNKEHHTITLYPTPTEAVGIKIYGHEILGMTGEDEDDICLNLEDYLIKKLTAEVSLVTEYADRYSAYAEAAKAALAAKIAENCAFTAQELTPGYCGC